MTDCWNCLYFKVANVDGAYSGYCGCNASFDGMGDEDCIHYEPLPKGACCARCSHYAINGWCSKKLRILPTPDATPCRDYDPERVDESQDDDTPLLPGIDK